MLPLLHSRPIKYYPPYRTLQPLALHWMKRNPARVIQGVSKCLKPGGRFVAEVNYVNRRFFVLYHTHYCTDSPYSARTFSAAGS